MINIERLHMSCRIFACIPTHYSSKQY